MKQSKGGDKFSRGAIGNLRRAKVKGWRWDFLTPWGWLPSSGVQEHYGIPAEPQGWYKRERAICLVRDHHAPHPKCACGLHGIEHLSMAVANQLEELSAQRDQFITDGDVPHRDTLVIALSRVTFRDVLPSAWPDDTKARAAHPAAVPDPPATIRGHRKTYREILVDREWPARPGTWPAAVMPKHGVHFVPNLAEWVRGQIAMPDEGPDDA